MPESTAPAAPATADVGPAHFCAYCGARCTIEQCKPPAHCGCKDAPAAPAEPALEPAPEAPVKPEGDAPPATPPSDPKASAKAANKK